jgi:hypothetical protein
MRLTWKSHARNRDKRAGCGTAWQTRSVLPRVTPRAREQHGRRGLGASSAAQTKQPLAAQAWRPPVIVGHLGDGQPKARMSARYARIRPALFPSFS